MHEEQQPPTTEGVEPQYIEDLHCSTHNVRGYTMFERMLETGHTPDARPLSPPSSRRGRKGKERLVLLPQSRKQKQRLAVSPNSLSFLNGSGHNYLLFEGQFIANQDRTAKPIVDQEFCKTRWNGEQCFVRGQEKMRPSGLPIRHNRCDRNALLCCMPCEERSSRTCVPAIEAGRDQVSRR